MGGETKKGNYAAIHASGFRDFLLKPELLRATVDCGFEHPSEVQHACIPQAILGTDILCQAKSGMGKTAVFVLACLQQIDASEKTVKVLVVCHTRELAYQIKHEFDRFAKYFEAVKTGVIFGGMPIAKDKEMLKDSCPHVLIGTPGRVLALCREKDLKLEFNQVVIFVKSVQRATALDKLLVECSFPSLAIHSGLKQEERINRYKQFKEFQKRIMVCTDLFGRGIDIERVNIVTNYDMPDDGDSYLHRVGRAGRFGTKGLALSFVASDEDEAVLKNVQERFEVNIDAMPATIDTTSYLNS